jgi:hypothetical protein
MATLGAVAVVFAALGACSRASTPPPSAEPVAEPGPSEPAPPVSAEPAPAEPAPAEPSPAPAPAASASGAAATPGECASAKDERQRLTCETKAELASFVAAHQSCKSAAECTVVTGTCPFGCYVAVTKAAEAETVKTLSALGDRLEKAGHKCVYRCMNPPSATCDAGRCATAPAK